MHEQANRSAGLSGRIAGDRAIANDQSISCRVGRQEHSTARARGRVARYGAVLHQQAAGDIKTKTSADVGGHVSGDGSVLNDHFGSVPHGKAAAIGGCGVVAQRAALQCQGAGRKPDINATACAPMPSCRSLRIHSMSTTHRRD